MKMLLLFAPDDCLNNECDDEKWKESCLCFVRFKCSLLIHMMIALYDIAESETSIKPTICMKKKEIRKTIYSNIWR